MDDEIQETQEDSNKKHFLQDDLQYYIVAISILRKAMNEQNLPLYDEIQKLEREFDKKFIQSYKKMNLEQYFLVKI